MKRILSWVLALVMLLSGFTFPAFADDAGVEPEEQQTEELAGELLLESTGEQTTVLEASLPVEEPAVIEGTPVAEEPALAKEVLVAEETAENEETPAAEEPAEHSETPAAEEPASAEKQPAAEKPTENEETPAAEEPAEHSETPAAEEPTENEETPAAEEPASAEKLPEAEEQTENEETPAAEEPTPEEELTVVEEPADKAEITDAEEPAAIFNKGYAWLNAGTIIYSNSRLTREAGKLANGEAVYVKERIPADSTGQDVLCLIYALNGKSQKGFVKAGKAREMGRAETEEQDSMTDADLITSSYRLNNCIFVEQTKQGDETSEKETTPSAEETNPATESKSIPEQTEYGFASGEAGTEAEPTETPTTEPTKAPTVKPTKTPAMKPAATPTAKPTAIPTVKPTKTPAVKPTVTHTAKPTSTPTAKSAKTPAVKLTVTPTEIPTAVPADISAPAEMAVSETDTDGAEALSDEDLFDPSVKSLPQLSPLLNVNTVPDVLNAVPMNDPIAPGSIKTSNFDALTSKAISIIRSHESAADHYQAIGDAGTSVGIIQWHGGRALNVVRRAIYKNPNKAYEILGADLYNKLESTDTTTLKVSGDEKTKLKAFLGTQESMDAQDEQARSDVSGYLTAARKYYTNDALLLFYADICNYGGSGNVDDVRKAAKAVAGSDAAVTIEIFREEAHKNKIVGDNATNGSGAVYKERIDNTYNQVKKYSGSEEIEVSIVKPAWIVDGVTMEKETDLKTTGAYTISESANVGDVITIQVMSNTEWSIKQSTGSNWLTRGASATTSYKGEYGVWKKLKFTVSAIPAPGVTYTSDLLFTVGGKTYPVTISMTKPENVEIRIIKPAWVVDGVTKEEQTDLKETGIYRISKTASVGDEMTIKVKSNTGWNITQSTGSDWLNISSVTNYPGSDVWRSLKLTIAAVPAAGTTITSKLVFKVGKETYNVTVKFSKPEVADISIIKPAWVVDGVTKEAQTDLKETGLYRISKDASVGDVMTIQVMSDTEWSITQSTGSDWLTRNATATTSYKGERGVWKKLKFTITAVPAAGTTNTARLVFKAGKETYNVTIKFSKPETANISIIKPAWVVDGVTKEEKTDLIENRIYRIGKDASVGDVMTIKVKSDTAWSFTQDTGSDWLTVPSTKNYEASDSWRSLKLTVAAVPAAGTVNTSRLIFKAGRDSYNVTVKFSKPETSDIKITGITLSMPSQTIGVGKTNKTCQQTVTYIPSNATNKSVTWSSGNTAIATVNTATGIVTGVAGGYTTITATAADGSGKTASYKVYVVGKPVIKLGGTAVTAGTTKTWNPANALSITWSGTYANRYIYKIIALNEIPSDSESQGSAAIATIVNQTTAVTTASYSLTSSQLASYAKIARYLKIWVKALHSNGDSNGPVAWIGVDLQQSTSCTLDLSTTSWSGVSYSGASKNVTVTCDGDYTVSIDQPGSTVRPTEDGYISDWLSYTKSGSTLTLKAKPNYADTTRSAKVTVKCKTHNVSKVLTVTQSARSTNTPYITVSVSPTTVQAGDQVTVKVSYRNVQRLNIFTDDIGKDPASGTGNHEETVTLSTTTKTLTYTFTVLSSASTGKHKIQVSGSNSDVKNDSWAQFDSDYQYITVSSPAPEFLTTPTVSGGTYSGDRYTIKFSTSSSVSYVVVCYNTGTGVKEKSDKYYTSGYGTQTSTGISWSFPYYFEHTGTSDTRNVILRCYDANGNYDQITSNSFTCKAKGIAPTITLKTNTNTASNSGTGSIIMTFTYTYTDEFRVQLLKGSTPVRFEDSWFSGTTRIYDYNDFGLSSGGLYTSATQTNTISPIRIPAGTAEGTYTLKVTASNHDGLEASSSVSIRVVSSYYASEAVSARMDDLYTKLGGGYFTVNRSSCTTTFESGHACDNCFNENIIQTSWFKQIFGDVSWTSFPASSGYTQNGWSCLGFAHFAAYWIYRDPNNPGAKVSSTKIGTFTFNQSNATTYAQTGDLIRFNSSHSAICYYSDSNGMYVLDCNYKTDGTQCRVAKHYIPYSMYTSFTVNRCGQ